MRLDIDNKTESLDFYMEVLWVVHKYPNSSAKSVFEHASLAMDEASCQSVLDSLQHQGLISSTGKKQYCITASGRKTLIPIKRNASFPQVALSTYNEALQQTSSPTLIVEMQDGCTRITKSGVTLVLSDSEMQQLGKRLQQDAGLATG